MNLPSPPTDSLYKFLAISGVVISILSVVLWYQGERNIFLMALDAKRTVAASQYKHELILQESAGTAVDSLWDDFHNVDLTSSRTPVVEEIVRGRRLLREFARQSDANYQRVGELAEAIAANRYAVDRLNYLGRQRRVLNIASFVGVLVGVILTTVGFHQWYVKVQVYQNTVMREQAISAVYQRQYK